MSKRGEAETAIVLLVLAIAIIGAIFVFIPTSTVTGMKAREPPRVLPTVGLPIEDCKQRCMEIPKAQEEMQKCFTYCEQQAGVFTSGSFAVSKPAEYGGSIAGIARETRAFQAGRAYYQLPEQACYTCNCLKQGITAADRDAAEKVCTDNCGGQITTVVVGQC
ncbi:MAG: hypothetical protein NTW67_02590 [Candidatus Woesearchaeota archaeon]|nr:hypothetical protein [Candidatus Woesearchaeota archaeon]